MIFLISLKVIIYNIIRVTRIVNRFIDSFERFFLKSPNLHEKGPGSVLFDKKVFGFLGKSHTKPAVGPL
jgi:hypothetical protein